MLEVLADVPHIPPCGTIKMVLKQILVVFDDWFAESISPAWSDRPDSWSDEFGVNAAESERTMQRLAAITFCYAAIAGLLISQW